jgi:hypothetical protein
MDTNSTPIQPRIIRCLSCSAVLGAIPSVDVLDVRCSGCGFTYRAVRGKLLNVWKEAIYSESKESGKQLTGYSYSWHVQWSHGGTYTYSCSYSPSVSVPDQNGDTVLIIWRMDGQKHGPVLELINETSGAQYPRRSPDAPPFGSVFFGLGFIATIVFTLMQVPLWNVAGSWVHVFVALFASLVCLGLAIRSRRQQISARRNSSAVSHFPLIPPELLDERRDLSALLVDTHNSCAQAMRDRDTLTRYLARLESSPTSNIFTEEVRLATQRLEGINNLIATHNSVTTQIQRVIEIIDVELETASVSNVLAVEHSRDLSTHLDELRNMLAAREELEKELRGYRSALD